MTSPDPAWPRQYDVLAARIREALGWRVLQLDHVGSTAVPGLPTKPIIDVDLTVAAKREAASRSTPERLRLGPDSSGVSSRRIYLLNMDELRDAIR